MTLTEEQARAAAEQPAGVRLADPASNREYVLVRADVFDQLRELLYDDAVVGRGKRRTSVPRRLRR